MRSPQLSEVIVCGGKWAGAEKAPAGGQWGRVHRLYLFHIGVPGEKGAERLGVFTPENGDERGAPVHKGGDDMVGDFFPPFFPVRAGPAGLGADGEDSVEQHDALVAPGAEITVSGPIDAEIGLEFGKNVHQAFGQGLHLGTEGER